MNTPATNVDSLNADKEARIVSELAAFSTLDFLQSLGLVSESYLAQVLIALWDSGVYEYVRLHECIEVQTAATELGLDEETLRSLVEYLVGRGLMQPSGNGFVLSDKGRPYWNYLTRGVLTCHVGAYSPLFTHLGPLLRKEITIEDPCLNRVGRMIALGSGYSILGNGTIAWVRDAIRKLEGKHVLDLGCGAGDFLIQLALKWPLGAGMGIDLDADAIAAARKNAETHGVAQRIQFAQATLSAKPMEIPTDALAKVDILTAIFMLHEFGGRGGPEAISTLIRSLRAQFPGRKLLMVEGTRADPVELCTSPPRTYGQLDYSFLHPLSRQGPLRTPDEWRKIIEDGGARLDERIAGFRLIPSWVGLYIISL